MSLLLGSESVTTFLVATVVAIVTVVADAVSVVAVVAVVADAASFFAVVAVAPAVSDAGEASLFCGLLFSIVWTLLLCS